MQREIPAGAVAAHGGEGDADHPGELGRRGGRAAIAMADPRSGNFLGVHVVNYARLYCDNFVAAYTDFLDCANFVATYANSVAWRKFVAAYPSAARPDDRAGARTGRYAGA
ncbi:hypothetical protein GCM10022416_12910 [Actinomadura keratinilytica]|uniref:Uncharacterized protein n=1 Tax=Actinomadura keratinilytica TaxID=547461 RepID=A0ABP7Y9C0_9ACTN